MKKMILYFLIIMAILLSPFVVNKIQNPRVSIEQRVSVKSIITGERYVTTQIWINDWMGYAVSLEYWRQVTVNYLKVDSTRDSELAKAVPVYNTIKNLYP